MSISFNHLNDRQFKAVTFPDKSTLVLAGAGSGKTRVLTYRIAYLLESSMAKTSEILAVTFTNKAAKEMVTRLESLLPYDLRRMWVGTFHGLCHRILRAHAAEAGLDPKFQILDNSDQLSLVKRVMKARNVDPQRVQPKSLQNFINWSKEHQFRPEQLNRDEVNQMFRELYASYEDQCRRENVVDFAELILRTVELLERNALVRSHYQSRFKYILVDEFQDTNSLQYKWLMLLSGASSGGKEPPKNVVCAVGDDDQSIYAFRGADVTNMKRFIRDYQVAAPVRLEENYRSTSTILDVANAVISHNEGRLGKNLWTSGDAGEKVVVRELETEEAEALWVKDEIEKNLSRGFAYRDNAVLYRTNAQSRAFEVVLAQSGIPYRIYGGLRFFDRAEVKNVVAYLRLIANPNDDTSFLRVVNLPTRGIGAKSQEALADLARSRNCSLWAAMHSEDPAAPAKIKVFTSLISSMRTYISENRLNLAEAIEYVVNSSGIKSLYAADPNREDREENMLELVTAAAGYLKTIGVDENAPAMSVSEVNDLTPLEGFLSQASLEPGETNEGDDMDMVQLMTIHAAKGLEFNQVFIAGFEDGILPHFGASSGKEGEAKQKKAIEEERRLTYVAVTRARKRLCISYCRSRFLFGDRHYNDVSRFFEEIPSELIEHQPLPKEKPASTFGFESKRGFDEFRKRPASSESSFSPAPKKSRETNKWGLAGGDEVAHPKLGRGRIIRIIGDLAEIKFESRPKNAFFQMSIVGDLLKKI